MKNLEETIDLMKSTDYKKRFVAEYWQTKIRYDKLKNFIAKIEIAKLKDSASPKHDCPLSFLKKNR